MAYLALYRKWRPKTFTDVVGQKHISETLMRAIRENKVAHAYLFSGPRGTGKTSLAKIFARAMNCENGPTDTPCNKCKACAHILAGDSMDVIEIDAASNRGIDEIRSLRESAQFLPIEGRKKIFIIDEAHMLTTEAWNALLKTVEEPPAHVMFIFATTEVEKIPVTIVSRCQRYAFRRITAEDITTHLLHVAKESHIHMEEQAARLMAVRADGGLRDALSMLDQCSGMSDGTITSEAVEDMLGLLSKDTVINLFGKIREGDGSAVLLAIKDGLMKGQEAIQLVDVLAEHARALMLYKVLPTAEELSVYETLGDALQSQAKAITAVELEGTMADLQRIQQDAKRVDNPRIVVEMGLLGMCAQALEKGASLEPRVAALERRQQGEDSALRTRIAQLENGQRSMAPPVVAEVASSPERKSDVRERPALQVPDIPPPKATVPDIFKKRKAKGTSPMQKASFVQGEVIIGQAIESPNTYREIQGKAINAMGRHNNTMCETFCKKGQLIYVDESRAVLAFESPMHVKVLSTPQPLEIVKDSFSVALGRHIVVEPILFTSPEAKAYIEAAGGNTKGASSGTNEEKKVEKATERKAPVVEEFPGIEEIPAPEEFHVEGVPPGAKRWTPETMTDEEREHPLLATALEGLAETHDIYVTDDVDDMEEN